MHLFLTILTALLLAVIIYQDFRWRAIHWITLPFLFLLLGWQALNHLTLTEVVLNTALGFGFVAFQVAALTLYVSLKEKKFVNIARSHLGIGDILFFIAISTGFSFINYLLFYVAGFIITIVGYLFISLLRKNKKGTIPLAGALAGCFLLCMIINGFSRANLFYNDLVLLWLSY